jgi:hypothetical protein
MFASFLLSQLLVFVSCFAIGLTIALVLPKRLVVLLRVVARRMSGPWVAPLTVGLLAALLAAGISLLRPPLPSVHDEFSYLLAADTFARGRLTNPPHPMWPYFETFHVLQQPTYASKYPPAQGMLLAVGKIAAGCPAAGLWLGMGLAASAVCWMLRGWMPARWALLGGLLVAFHANLQLEWGQTYWGGNVALVGGALLLGAYPRLVRRCRRRDAFWMAAGLAILANSRPYEGLAVSLPVAIAVLAWLLGRCRPTWKTSFRLAIPLGLVLGITGGWMAYYNMRITGRAWIPPYVIHERTYSHTPLFLWQQPRPAVDYQHRVMRRFYLAWVHQAFERQQNFAGLVEAKRDFLLSLWYFLLSPLTLALVAGCDLIVKRRWRLPFAMLLAALLATAGSTWNHVHYLAPAVAPLVLAVVLGIRRLRVLTWRRTSHRSVITRSLIFTYLVMFALFASIHLVDQKPDFAQRRHQVLERLERTAGRHLVIVRYRSGHDTLQEWVYNDADIDAAKVVWARSVNSAADKRLREYFHDRQIWLLEADEFPPRLRLYHRALSPNSTHSAAQQGGRKDSARFLQVRLW